MKIEINAVGEGAQEFMDRVHRLLARDYRRRTVSQRGVGVIATMEADIEPKEPEREVRDEIVGGYSPLVGRASYRTKSKFHL